MKVKFPKTEIDVSDYIEDRDTVYVRAISAAEQREIHKKANSDDTDVAIRLVSTSVVDEDDNALLSFKDVEAMPVNLLERLVNAATEISGMTSSEDEDDEEKK